MSKFEKFNIRITHECDVKFYFSDYLHKSRFFLYEVEKRKCFQSKFLQGKSLGQFFSSKIVMGKLV